ncbi:hypothetical protein LCGC14_2013950 [marine sediment metagenome]|uniref:Uncharacterized protein n=1 Tax=marine sediment metagenome TaxID=412755 RepID=A0A0F9FLY1_9ZZZZ
MKLYCPECGKEVDETEFMELNGKCATCYLNTQKKSKEDISNET